MKFDELAKWFLVLDDRDECFVSWIVRKSHVLLVQDGKDENWLHAVCFQQNLEDENIIIHFEGYTDGSEPLIVNAGEDIPVQVYSRII